MDKQSELKKLSQQAKAVGLESSDYIEKWHFAKSASKLKPTEAELLPLLQHINRVYLIFILELGYTFGLSYFFYSHPDSFVNFLETTHLMSELGMWIVVLVPIALLAVITFSKQLKTKMLALVGFITLMSIQMTYIILLVDSIVLFEALGITVVIYLVTSLYGLITKDDMTGWRGPLCGSLFSVILLGLFQFVYRNSWLECLIIAADILVFTLYIMYDNQMMKVRFLNKSRDGIYDSPESWWVLAIDSSIDIYLDFINLFLDILSLFGDGDD